jgi:enoyl-CoA hydratase
MSKVLVSQEIIEPGILSVIIKNHNKRNALSDNIKLELESIALDLRDNTDVKAVILSGENGNFSSGNDTKDKNAFGEGLGLAEARQKNRLGLRMCDAWTNIPQVSVASIQGACIGGGVTLALSCDFRFCSSDAYFYVPEVELGITYAWGSIPKLVSLVGPSRAKLFALACKKLDANTLIEWGLCEKITEDPLIVSKELLKEIIKKPIVAQQMVKESINRQVNLNQISILEQDQVLLTRKYNK